MVPGLVPHLSARFVFVVGKGGVGKTTTAAALALELADGGEATHLLSSDPAHSLGDVFAEAFPGGGPAPSGCSPSLTVEELDAVGLGRRWLAEVREAVADLVERGTYLDREDVVGLLDQSLPGVDEVMAALRIAELAESGEYGRIVVDTAPTGHTLRLLDCGQVLEGWLATIHAMADKAGAVAFGLTGRRARFSGERVMDRVQERVSRFTEGIVTDADFVLVTRDGEPVEAESVRLARALRDRGLRLSMRVGVGGLGSADFGDLPSFEAAIRHDLIGCEGLRRWGAPGERADRAVQIPAPARTGALDLVTPRELILFGGKGGVGKTTCAAAYAVALARKRRVLLLSLDPEGSLGDVLGRPVTPDETEVLPGLFARQLDAAQRFERLRETYRGRVQRVFERLGLDRSASLDRRVLESIVEMAPPGLDEIFALDAILDGAGVHDVLVVDTAPTGHFLRVLEMPVTALDWTRAVLRILLRYRAVLGLDDFAADLLAFARRLRGVIQLLGDEARTGVVVVTLGEALPRLETGRLVSALRAGGTPLAAIIHNRWTGLDSDMGVVALPREGLDAPQAIVAPLVDPAPLGPDRLLDFSNRWAAA